MNTTSAQVTGSRRAPRGMTRCTRCDTFVQKGFSHWSPTTNRPTCKAVNWKRRALAAEADAAWQKQRGDDYHEHRDWWRERAEGLAAVARSFRKAVVDTPMLREEDRADVIAEIDEALRIKPAGAELSVTDGEKL